MLQYESLLRLQTEKGEELESLQLLASCAFASAHRLDAPRPASAEFALAPRASVARARLFRAHPPSLRSPLHQLAPPCMHLGRPVAPPTRRALQHAAAAPVQRVLVRAGRTQAVDARRSSLVLAQTLRRRRDARRGSPRRRGRRRGRRNAHGSKKACLVPLLARRRRAGADDLAAPSKAANKAFHSCCFG